MRHVGGLCGAARAVRHRNAEVGKQSPLLAAVDRDERPRIAGVREANRRGHRVGDHEFVGRLRAGVAIVEHEDEPVAGNDDLRFFEQDTWLAFGIGRNALDERSEEHTSELQSLMRISYAVFCLKKKNNKTNEEKLHK